MVDTATIRAEMARNGHTIKSLAKKRGVTPKTMSAMIKTGKMGLEDARFLTVELKLKDPNTIFFA